MSKENRFVSIYKEGMLNTTEIWVDKETGVNYMVINRGYGLGLTPFLDKDGKPVVTDTNDLDRYW
ncbi:MAG: xylan 1,4-beta-xylosidase [Tissierellia bacterium]|nr:xylan 1,4-beta-xylosidase [Tissierellia bacterium]